jgi:hypothetical protein
MIKVKERRYLDYISGEVKTQTLEHLVKQAIMVRIELMATIRHGRNHTLTGKWFGIDVSITE